MTHLANAHREHTTIRLGGVALIAGAAAFLAVFSFLAARFDYPAILDGTAAEVLPRLRATGATGRAVWALYGFLPLVWIPAGVGAFHALRRGREGSMRIGMLFALLATVSMMLGLLRWPSIHWVLAEAYARGGEPERTVLAAVFTGLDWPAHPWCRPRGFGIFATTDVTSSHPYRSFARREGLPRERCTARDFVGRE